MYNWLKKVKLKSCTTFILALYNTLYNKLPIIAHYCTICTILYKTLYNFVFKPIFQLYNFSTCFVCTTFCTIWYNMCTVLCNIVQVVQVVQPFVQYCNGLVCRWNQCQSLAWSQVHIYKTFSTSWPLSNPMFQSLVEN